MNSLSTSITDFDVDFYAKDDSITYTVDVENAGDYDATLELINYNNPICTGSGSNVLLDQQLVCSNINYSLTYENDSQVSVNDDLLVGETKKIKIKISYIGDTMPNELVDVENLGIQLTYIQK